ncbi:hypothetical protein [Pedobacter rhodius]|uniref:START domain-containing protein n=1 Tax=Pedobacter rhodius TaxID=3004098 RepID=A0ABT4KWN2_9SPHI|nr:hypothetical protein [Pedobacter sp. SJ11]MCZ4223335.1 hypothetical protein [Pedobacter sp. SJ11]
MKKYFTLIIGLLISVNGFAQDGNWKTATLKDGKVNVKSKIVTQKVNNKEKNVFYYVVETVVDVNLGKAETFMRNSANYKKFLENMGATSELKKISANAWLTYIYFDNSWPVSDNDCVQKFEFVKTNNGFYISGKAAPTEFEVKKVERINLYDVVYKFEQIADKKIKVSIDAVFSPTGAIPKVLMNSWLPNGPERIISRLVESISK